MRAHFSAINVSTSAVVLWFFDCAPPGVRTYRVLHAVTCKTLVTVGWFTLPSQEIIHLGAKAALPFGLHLLHAVELVSQSLAFGRPAVDDCGAPCCLALNDINKLPGSWNGWTRQITREIDSRERSLASTTAMIPAQATVTTMWVVCSFGSCCFGPRERYANNRGCCVPNCRCG